MYSTPNVIDVFIYLQISSNVMICRTRATDFLWMWKRKAFAYENVNRFETKGLISSQKERPQVATHQHVYDCRFVLAGMDFLREFEIA